MLLAVLGLLVLGSPSGGAAERPGVPPTGLYACPDSHPIKGYLQAGGGRRVYFAPTSAFYDEASPDRCYASEDEAQRDGTHPAAEPRPRPRWSPDLV